MTYELIIEECLTREGFETLQWFKHNVLGYKNETFEDDIKNQQVLSCVVSNPEVFRIYNWKYIEVNDDETKERDY